MKGKHLLIMLICLIVGCNSPPVDTKVPPTTQSPTITPNPSAITPSPSPSPTITPIPSSTPDISVCPGKKIIYTYGGLRAACFDQDQVYFDYPIPGAKEGDKDYALSPNGEMVAFANIEGIRIYDLQGNEITTLLEAQNAWTLTWSPDNEYIAYIEVIQHPLTFRLKFIHIATQTVSDNYVSSENLGFLRGETNLNPSWSPDGQKLALINIEFSELYVMDVDCGEDSHMCIVSNAINVPCSDLEPDRCYRYDHAAWAPDSEHLVVALSKPYDGDYEGYEFSWINVLRIIDLSGTVIEEINPLDYDIMMPERLDWSTDGQDILFFAYPVDTVCSSIYVLTLEDISIYRVPLVNVECPHSAMWIR